jgi:PadR family transcriptional regulator PadR
MDEEMLLVLLDQWESVYKKSLLTFWLLLLLCERPMYVFEMGEALTEISQGSMTADEKSLYRALRRFEAMALVESTWYRSDLGPRRRYYRPTLLGIELLRRFIHRNILVFQEPVVANRLVPLLTKSS